MHVATIRDLRIYEHPGLPLSSLPLDMQRIQADTNTNISLSTRHGHVFSAGALTLDLERSSLPRVPRRSRSWWILSRHGRLPTKDLPFHTHVIILFTEYRSTFSVSSGRSEREDRREERKKRTAGLVTCVLVFYTCIHTHAYALWIEPKGRVDVSTKASRFSRLICCYSCLRRADRPVPSAYDPQTFIMFFCNTSTNATGIAAFTRHPVCSAAAERSVFRRVHRSANRLY